jgi:hypothetical protein
VRSYAKNPEEVEDRAKRALDVGLAAAKLFIYGEPAFDRVLFVVPKDYDCGRTAGAIGAKLFGTVVPYDVIEVSGHHSSGALNEALAYVRDQLHMSHVLIMSGKAVSYLTEPTLEAMDDAFALGAQVVGVEVDELAEIVREGRVQNTFCGWEVNPLLDVGAFDSTNGVEEIAPTVKLIREYGPCVAVIKPSGDEELDILKSDTAITRHREVMETKAARQIEEAKRLYVDFSFIEQGIIPGYPKVL